MSDRREEKARRRQERADAEERAARREAVTLNSVDESSYESLQLTDVHAERLGRYLWARESNNEDVWNNERRRNVFIRRGRQIITSQMKDIRPIMGGESM